MMSNTQKPDPTRVKIAWQDPVMMQIGKSGISEGVVLELGRLLKEHKYIKVRVLRSALDTGLTKESLLQQICERTGSTLAGVRGNTAVLFRLRPGS
jgi:RNA-binding protein YhbY